MTVRHPQPSPHHRQWTEPQGKWYPSERPVMCLAGDNVPRHSPAPVRPTRGAHGPVCSYHLHSCVSQAIELVHHAPLQNHATAMAVASCSAECVPNARGSLVGPTMSAAAVVVAAVMMNMTGRKMPVGPRQTQRNHSLDVRLDPPCLGCVGNHWPVSDHPRNVGYSARERRHRLFP
jgi:hypothetical protein